MIFRGKNAFQNAKKNNFRGENCAENGAACMSVFLFLFQLTGKEAFKLSESPHNKNAANHNQLKEEEAVRFFEFLFTSQSNDFQLQRQSCKNLQRNYIIAWRVFIMHFSNLKRSNLLQR
jgi:hypothetical protein